METNPNVLIDDDDKDDIDLFCEAIGEIYPDRACHIANDCGEALEKLRGGSDVLPDLIFLDLNMSGMYGRACLAELKKDVKLKNIPVIIYTTSSHEKDRVVTLKLGTAYFLAKANLFG